MLKVSENPPVVCPGDAGIEEIEGTWWVAHTKPRQEKALAWDVLRSGGGYFLPMYEAVRRSRGRSWKTMLPLFPGYVFLCGDDTDRMWALETHRVVNAIPVPDQPALATELRAIERLLASKSGIDAYPGLARGAACRIRSGPLMGLEGHVARRKGRTRFIVNVAILGQGAAVEIDADLLDPTG